MASIESMTFLMICVVVQFHFFLFLFQWKLSFLFVFTDVYSLIMVFIRSPRNHSNPIWLYFSFTCFHVLVTREERNELLFFFNAEGKQWLVEVRLLAQEKKKEPDRIAFRSNYCVELPNGRFQTLSFEVHYFNKIPQKKRCQSAKLGKMKKTKQLVRFDQPDLISVH